jgi:hypothetical protein
MQAKIAVRTARKKSQPGLAVRLARFNLRIRKYRGRLETCPLSEDSSEKQGLSTPVDTGIDTSDPNLAKVMNAWPTLPEPIRRAMLALIG